MNRLLDRVGVPLAALLLAGSVWGCVASEPAPPAPRPNILLIVSDTLRADALSCYGGEAQTPNICSLAERGVRFERSFANAPWTLPSSVAMFTGNYPNLYRRQLAEGEKTDAFFFIQKNEHLLAEELVEQGYEANSWVENGIARRAHTMQGFTRRDGQGIPHAAVPMLTERVGFDPLNARYMQLAWAVDYLLSEPLQKFFLVQWINDPHAEYRPPRPRREREGLTMEGYPRGPRFYLGLGHHDNPSNDQHKLRDVADTLNEEELALVKRLYLMETESVDERVGFLLKALEVSGLEDDTLVIFTSDHGEGFGEHGRFLHGDSLYNELVHIPLIIAGPGVAGGRTVRSPVSLVDLVPTLKDILQLDGLEDLQGRSLKALLSGERDEDNRRLHYLASPDRLDRDALVSGHYKLISGPEGGSVELYDLDADPAEKHNLAADLPEVVASLQDQIERIRLDNDRRWQDRLAGDDAADLAETQRRTQEQMEAVGYLD